MLFYDNSYGIFTCILYLKKAERWPCKYISKSLPNDSSDATIISVVVVMENVQYSNDVKRNIELSVVRGVGSTQKWDRVWVRARDSSLEILISKFRIVQQSRTYSIGLLRITDFNNRCMDRSDLDEHIPPVLYMPPCQMSMVQFCENIKSVSAQGWRWIAVLLKSSTAAPSASHMHLNAHPSSGAGSGMAGRAAAIPIWNLVWRRHTNLRCRYFARFNTEKLVTPLLLSFYFFTNYFTNRHFNSAYLPTYWLRPTYLLLHRHWWKAWLPDRLGAGGFPLVRVHQ